MKYTLLHNKKRFTKENPHFLPALIFQSQTLLHEKLMLGGGNHVANIRNNFINILSLEEQEN